MHPTSVPDHMRVQGSREVAATSVHTPDPGTQTPLQTVRPPLIGRASVTVPASDHLAHCSPSMRPKLGTVGVRSRPRNSPRRARYAPAFDEWKYVSLKVGRDGYEKGYPWDRRPLRTDYHLDRRGPHSCQSNCDFNTLPRNR